MEMEDQYGIADLRQLITRAAVAGNHQYSPYSPQNPPPPDLFSPHPHRAGLTPPPTTQYEMVVMGRHVTTEVVAGDMYSNHSHQARGGGGGGGGVGFQQYHQHHQLNNCDSTTTGTTAGVTSSGGLDGGDGGSARWPRQETLTLLEIRSRLHHKFKEANQKGPLWDEVARIMSEEHGYQRSGKKCREKLENLYKYYKKTKEGKAGRQDGKHYRFFRQLEALYGASTSVDETHIPQNTPHFHNNNPISSQPMNPHHLAPRGLCDTSVSLSNSTEFEPSSSEDDDDDDDHCDDPGEPSMESNGSRDRSLKKKKGKRGNWKGKIKEFIDSQMRNVMEKQEAMLEKMMKTLEGREQERLAREEEWWRRQEAARVEREHKFWEGERAWVETRDSALIKALDKLTQATNLANCGGNSGAGAGGGGGGSDHWHEQEIKQLIQLRTNMESRLQQCGISEEVLWEDIASKMAYFGYERSAIVCKEKWDSIFNKDFLDKGSSSSNSSSRKRKEDYNNNYGVSNLNEGGLYMNQLSGFNNCEI